MPVRRILIVIGVVVALVGVFWIAQGLGYVRWPASSTMIGQSAWSDRGAIVAVLGLVLILAARRLRR